MCVCVCVCVPVCVFSNLKVKKYLLYIYIYKEEIKKILERYKRRQNKRALGQQETIEMKEIVAALTGKL